ncbi:sulfotransferase family 2 domain-containing protein [Alteromonas sp. ASW11-130]|uniref:sulfotransferase family 2 domain-containing protein n=1 Tax=Alteromonas sp. ASW11-130 TaxID=3015775 RepID=UPI002241DD8B|nr:sulfotransferase family 2 domain-containing protein [Alteromonas sp. ASW11-130]MCW8090399.1 sulfotransferase family 2 domain-containing protein [Alteromonas sp. ASW11-130]
MQELLKRQSKNFLARYPRIFFCHVPKCAGVSLSKAIYSSTYPLWLKATRYTGFIDLKSSQVAADLLNIDMMTARETQLVFQLNDPQMRYTNGHCVANPQVVSKYCNDWHFITILRDPAKRFISEFVYNRFKSSEWQKHNDTLDSYLESEKAVSSALTYARYFSGTKEVDAILANPKLVVDAALTNLGQFSVCGTLENMSQWQQKFNEVFNTKIEVASKNESPNQQAYREITSNKGVMEKIKNLCEIDYEIFNTINTK